MPKGHQIVQEISIEEFLQRIADMKRENVEVTKHTVFRLQEKQRKVFKEEVIRDILLYEKPEKVMLQRNGCYSVTYRHKGDKLKMVLEITVDKIEAVTFWVV